MNQVLIISNMQECEENQLSWDQIMLVKPTYLKRPLSVFDKASVTRTKYFPGAPSNFGWAYLDRSAFEKEGVTKKSIVVVPAASTPSFS